MNQEKNLITQFKNSMANLASGVAIVTIAHKNSIYGITISSFHSISLNPQLILFNIDKQTTKLDLYLNAQFFTISLLSEKQKNISSYFAQSNKEQNTIKQWIEKVDNHYFISNSICYFQCKAWKTVEAGDSYIVIGEVINSHILNPTEKPLVYFQRNYFSLSDKINE